MLRAFIFSLAAVCCVSSTLDASEASVFDDKIVVKEAQNTKDVPTQLLSLIENNLIEKIKQELNISFSEKELKEEWDKLNNGSLTEETLREAKLKSEAIVDLVTILRSAGKENANERYRLKYAGVLTIDEWEFYRENDSKQVDLEKIKKSTPDSVEEAFESSKKSLTKDILRRDVMLAHSQSKLAATAKQNIEGIILAALGKKADLTDIKSAYARQSPNDVSSVYAAQVFWYAFILNGISSGDIQIHSLTVKSQIIEEISSRIVTSFQIVEIRKPVQRESLENRLNKPMAPDSKTD